MTFTSTTRVGFPAMINSMTELLTAIRTGRRIIAQRDRLIDCRILISEVRNALEPFENWEVHPTRQFIGPRARGPAGLLVVMGPSQATGARLDDSYGPIHPSIQSKIERYKSEEKARGPKIHHIKMGDYMGDVGVSHPIKTNKLRD
jgi:hypothetical protein